MSTAPSDRPPPPPGLVPPTVPSSSQLEPPLPPEPPVPPVPFGYTRSRSLTVSPVLMAWIPAVCLTIILLLTFFDWVGSSSGGSTVYSENAWRALSGIPYRNIRLENTMKKEAVWPTEVLNRVQSDVALMLPYVLALILALVIAWAERMVATLDRNRLPRSMQWVAAAWPYRIPITAGLATTALLLLLIQMTSGFGLERAARQVVREEFVAKRQAAAADPAELDSIAYQEEQRLASFHLERTAWLWFAVMLHFAVVAAMVVRSWLERRGNRPPPRIVFQY